MAFEGPSVKSAELNVQPILTLTPYQNKWIILARVISKSPVQTWNKSSGCGKFVYFHLLDESSEIRAIAFNDCVERFYDVLRVNEVFYVSNANIVFSKKYTFFKHDFEIHLRPDTTLVLCEGNTSSIPMLQFNFVPLRSLECVEKDAVVDVIGVCKRSSSMQTIARRFQNGEVKLRHVQLVDASGAQVIMTLWSKDAEDFDGKNNPVIAVKRILVTEFAGCSLSTEHYSIVQINPDIEEAHVLRHWFQQEGSFVTLMSLSNSDYLVFDEFEENWKSIAQIQDEMFRMKDKVAYHTTKATIFMIRRDHCTYMTCPSATCNNKVICINNCVYKCENCDREYDTFNLKMFLSINIADFSGYLKVICFGKVVESLLGTTVQQFIKLKETDEVDVLFLRKNFTTFIFRLRTKLWTFHNGIRSEITAVSVSPIDKGKYSHILLNRIKEMEKEF